MDKINIEQWRAVVGYEGLYEVSSLGRVKSLNYNHTGREEIMKTNLCGVKGYEYLQLTLSKKGTKKTWGVHVLVALAFPEICGLPFEGAQCNHKDEDHFNNVPENLNWLSRPDNLRFGTCQERKSKAMTNRPDKSKTVYQYTKSYELVKEWVSTQEVQRQTGFSQAHIAACARGKRKSAYGFVWSYTLL